MELWKGGKGQGQDSAATSPTNQPSRFEQTENDPSQVGGNNRNK